MTTTPSKTDALKPCPFCGNDKEPKLWDFDYFENDESDSDLRYTVVCDASRNGSDDVHHGCGADCGSHETEAQAIAAWNARADQPAADTKAVMEEFRAELFAYRDVIMRATMALGEKTKTNEVCAKERDVLEFVQRLASRASPSQPAEPQVGEEIMVNAHDVFQLPLQPSGLTSGPRFVVHVPEPQPAERGDLAEMSWAHEASEKQVDRLLDHNAELIAEVENAKEWRTDAEQRLAYAAEEIAALNAELSRLQGMSAAATEGKQEGDNGGAACA